MTLRGDKLRIERDGVDDDPIRLSECCPADALVEDLQALEERLVEQSPLFGSRLEIRALDIAGELQCAVYEAEGLVVVDVQSNLEVRRRDPLALDARLLFLEQLAANPVGVVRFEQLALLSTEPREIFIVAITNILRLSGQLLQMRPQGSPHALALLVGELNVRVIPLDFTLDNMDAVIGLRAAMLLPSATDEVLVVVAVTAANSGEEEPPPAFAAVDRAAQVVVLTPAAFSALTLRVKDTLDPDKGLLVHQRTMRAFDDCAVVADQTGVVIVTQHLCQAIDSQRLSFRSHRRACPQPLAVKDPGQF